MKFSMTLTAAAALLVNTQAFASTETFSHTTNSGSTPFTDSFTLSAFNTTLGTLTGVDIILSTTATAVVDIFNNTGSNQVFTNANSSVSVSITDPTGILATQNLVAAPISGSVDPGFNTFPDLSTSATSDLVITASNFSAYEAPVTNNALSFTLAGGVALFNGSSVLGVNFIGSTTIDSITEIIYTYTPTTNVPEPATIALLSLGLAGFAYSRRKTI